MMQMQKLGKNKFKDFSMILFNFGQIQDFQGLENEAIFSKILKIWEPCMSLSNERG